MNYLLYITPLSTPDGTIDLYFLSNKDIGDIREWRRTQEFRDIEDGQYRIQVPAKQIDVTVPALYMWGAINNSNTEVISAEKAVIHYNASHIVTSLTEKELAHLFNYGPYSSIPILSVNGNVTISYTRN